MCLLGFDMHVDKEDFMSFANTRFSQIHVVTDWQKARHAAYR